MIICHCSIDALAGDNKVVLKGKRMTISKKTGHNRGIVLALAPSGQRLHTGVLSKASCPRKN
jgi:hypothetical protein